MLDLFVIIYISCVAAMVLLNMYVFFNMARAGRKLEGVSIWGMHLGILFAPAVLPTVIIIMIGKYVIKQKIKKGLDKMEVELYGEH